VQLTPLARFFELGAILVPSGAANACLLGCFDPTSFSLSIMSIYYFS